MSPTKTTTFSAVYGPVKSWRYGRSLGIDPIGMISTCSFNCVYCQLGEIEDKTADRRVFVSTEKILQDLENFAPWDVDIITLSGSGEPTQALNLGDIIREVKILTKKPVAVLTNATLLPHPQVSADLTLADNVSIKLDGVSADQLQRINRPVSGINLSEIISGIQEFHRNYHGFLGIQTMVLSRWTPEILDEYIRLMLLISPQEIQLNTPTRPKPLTRQLDGRGNHSDEDRPYPVRMFKCLNHQELRNLADQIESKTHILVRCAPV